MNSTFKLKIYFICPILSLHILCVYMAICSIIYANGVNNPKLLGFGLNDNYFSKFTFLNTFYLC